MWIIQSSQTNTPATEIAEAGSASLTPKQVWLELMLMTIVGILIPFIVYVDMIVLFGEIVENSLTEACQLLLLILSAVLFSVGASRQSHATGYLAGMATFSMLMAIRESDGHLDIISQGFWVYPAIVCLGIGAAMVWINRETIKPALLIHLATRHGILVVLGLIVVIVFSRAFGSGDLWRAIMTDSYTWQIKGAIQEGIELLGYAIFAFGTVGSSRTGFR